MPYNGSGTYTNSYYPTQDRDNDIPILASKFEEFFQVDLPATFGLCVTRDGQGVITANFNFNNFRGVQLADPVSPQDAANKSYADAKDDLSEDNFWVGDSSGTKEEKTITEVKDILNIDNILYIRDENASPTNGGSSISGIQTRNLNTVKVNKITGASLSSNQITLPAGTYNIKAMAPSFAADQSRAILYDFTNSVNIEVGENGNANSSSFEYNRAIVEVFDYTFNAETVIELRHYTATARAVNGLGSSNVDGNIDVYSRILIEKIG